MANPRIDELRKRLEKEPGSRLFAQLAEELRKEGELEEAVKVCQAGLEKHPNYPSARMTLGRGLFDMGDLAGAREQFETVLKGAPDNILASRLLAEALEGLGELESARAQFQKTLVLAPGDKVAAGRLQELEAKLGGGVSTAPGGPAPAAAAAPKPAVAPGPKTSPGSLPPQASRSMPPKSAGPAPAATVVAAALARAAAAREQQKSEAAAAEAPRAGAPAEAAPAAEPAPIPLVTAEEAFELEQAHEAPTVAFVRDDMVGIESGAEPETVGGGAARPGDAVPSERTGPIPLVAAEEEFELEQAHEAPPVAFESAPAPTVPSTAEAGAGAETEPAPIPLVAAEEEFEIERPHEAAPVRFESEEPPETVALARPDLEALPALAREVAGEAAPPAGDEVLDFDEAPTMADVPAFKVEEIARRDAEPVVEVEAEEEARPETIPFAGAAGVPAAEGGAWEAEGSVEPSAVETSPPEASVPREPEAQAAPAVEWADTGTRPEPEPPPEAGIAEPPRAAAAAEAQEGAAAPEEPVSEEIASATLAELYFSQGFADKALEVYRTLLEREPGHERARARIAEIEAVERRVECEARQTPPAAEAGPTADARAARRAAIERTIGRLEAMLAAIRKE